MPAQLSYATACTPPPEPSPIESPIEGRPENGNIPDIFRRACNPCSHQGRIERVDWPVVARIFHCCPTEGSKHSILRADRILKVFYIDLPGLTCYLRNTMAPFETKTFKQSVCTFLLEEYYKILLWWKLYGIKSILLHLFACSNTWCMVRHLLSGYETKPLEDFKGVFKDFKDLQTSECNAVAVSVSCWSSWNIAGHCQLTSRDQGDSHCHYRHSIHGIAFRKPSSLDGSRFLGFEPGFWPHIRTACVQLTVHSHQESELDQALGMVE